ncbi:sensor histidine kinase [Leucobacter denitrificans]|uniref:histidine kinase n=1 Tax=Leucobacter denitrificans TaxID=683042 RepID=A0A7G9S584_9MICO|nr:HAMP domain-containing sensor histidine kinase [Leucobacter denitrificans]QNN63009.1 HAMP domain-containing histidine kinase [Leucobacter denitrificans]
MTDTSTRKKRGRRFAVSVRTRIVSVITLVTALGLIAVGLSVYLVERHRILEQVDVRLNANLESARYIVTEGPGGSGTWDSSTAALTAVVERMSPDDNTGAMGMAAGKITMVPGVQLDLDLRDEAEFAAHVERTRPAESAMLGTYAEDGVVWRYLVAPIEVVDSAEPADVAFVMVYDLEAELGEFNEAARMFIIVSAIVLAVVAGTGTFVATRLLRPLRNMRETTERVSARSLSERIPIVGNDDVAELAETINQMLDRLDDALDSQRQLLSDVGHELKTPITIVRGHVELMDPNDPEDARDTRELAMDELQRMGELVSDLSATASLHGPSPVQLAPVDTSDLLHLIARKAKAIQGATVTLGEVATGVAQLDSARITQAMLQLAQNAVTHGGGDVEIGGRANGPLLHLWVRDRGPGVPDDSKAKIFERFARGTGSDGRTGSGLGLNIVQVIARAHGGDVNVSDAAGGGAMFTITVPIAGTQFAGA